MQSHQVEVVRILLEAMACPNNLDQEGETLVHATVRENSPSCTPFMINSVYMDNNWVTFLRDFVIRGSQRAYLYHIVRGFCESHQYHTSSRQMEEKQHNMIVHLNSNNI